LFPSIAGMTDDRGRENSRENAARHSGQETMILGNFSSVVPEDFRYYMNRMGYSTSRHRDRE